MKSILTVLFFSCALSAFCQKETTVAKPDPQKKIKVVEASCGECQLGLKGTSCSLAVRIDGKAYFVDGTKIDEHGDAHAKDGFCNAIRKAEVQGDVVNDRFAATYFKLLPIAAAKEAVQNKATKPDQ